MRTPAQILRDSIPSVCQIGVIQAGEYVGSGSGFLCDRGLVTNAHVTRAIGDRDMVIRFPGQASHEYHYVSAKSRDVALAATSPPSEWDFDCFVLNPKTFGDRPALSMGDGKAVDVGDEIGLVGFPFGMSRPTVHRGFVSAVFQDNGVDQFQLDASVNGGNSGGPLFDVSNGQVVGIVTRALKGLERQFEVLLASFDHNVAALSASQAVGAISVGGVDPVRVVIAGQHQLKELAAGVLRSANVGIGYAFRVTELLRQCPTPSKET